MTKQEFISLLNDIKVTERSFRNIRTIRQNGETYIQGFEAFNHEYDYMLCFFIFLGFKGYINYKEVKTQEQFKDALTKIGNKSKALLAQEIWDVLANRYPYSDKLFLLIGGYNLSLYDNSTFEETLAQWGSTRCLYSPKKVPFIPHEPTCFNIIHDCQKQLGINMDCGDILLRANFSEILCSYIDNNPKKAHIYLYDCGNEIITVKIAMLLDYYSNIEIINDIDSRLFDGIISFNDNEDGDINWNSWDVHIKNGGFCIAGNQKLHSLNRLFYKYDIPLILETYDHHCILYRKEENYDKIVRYGSFEIVSSLDDDGYYHDTICESIKNKIFTGYYEELTKEDFKYTNGFKFNEVKRKNDQRNFVWVKKDDIIIPDEKDIKLLWDPEIDNNSIIESQNLSKDPFLMNAPKNFYLPARIYEPKEGGHIMDDCKIYKVREQDYGYEIPEKYVDIFKKCYYPNAEHDEKCDKFDKMLCCRVITHACLLYNRYGILKVNASPEHPVCFRNYSFDVIDESYMLYCESQVDPIRINPEYDENFIIYQLLHQSILQSTTHILVAPTKEEQHTYFLNKRLDYINKFKPVVDEIEAEVQNSISESPASITGVGFKNFRRFSNLPIMPLAGVNILVGANNSGKSSFVKGLILTLDNIKNYIVDNNDNSLLNASFRYNTNNFHDVHIGTFDRSYSYNAEETNKTSKDRTMSFILRCAHFEIEITVKPTSKIDTTLVPIWEISVRDDKRDAVFTFNYELMTTSARFSLGDEEVDYHSTGFTMKPDKHRIGESQIAMLIRSIIPDGRNKAISSTLKNEEQDKKLKGKAGFILEVADELERVIQNTRIEYIHAHGINQKVLFNYNDKNDYMAQTLHDLMMEKTGDLEEEFVRYWLREFAIGTDYDVHSIGGEAYILQIKNMAGRMIYLADMGMGTNQLVILILRLSIIIHRQRILDKNPYRPTIIVEEPEQNMHPAFQSKLATLFYDVHKKYGFNFIVETHSEYMVRRSQVIVANEKFTSEKELLKKNIFKVFYFPSVGQPYEMLYRTDGNFSNEFGKGFYDEANNLLFEII